MLSIEEGQKVDNAVENITDILSQDGMRFEMAKKVFDRIQVLFMDSPKHFLDEKDAKEVFGKN